MRSGPTRYNLETKSRSELLVSEDSDRGALFHEFWELTKPRLSLLAVITAIVGYLVAQPDRKHFIIYKLANWDFIGSGWSSGP